MAEMKASIRWIGKLAYQADSRGHKLMMDAKKESGGQDLGMTPKEMVLAGVCGCSGMDVISLLTSKFKLNVQKCEVSAVSTSSEGGHPVVWTKVEMIYDLAGEIPVESAIKAVELSMTKYCGVSAMLSKAVPISYKVLLNGSEVFSGQAKF